MDGDRRYFFRDTPVKALLLKLSWPSIVGMVVFSLYSVVDSAYIGYWGGANALAAVLVASVVEMVSQALGLIFGVGASIHISKALGAGDSRAASAALGSNLFAVVCFGFLYPLVVAPLAAPIVRLVGASDVTEAMAAEYARYISFACFNQMLIMQVNNCLRAEGNAPRSMVCMCLSAVLNCIIDPILIFKCDLGVRGAALSTNISSFIGAVYGLWPYLAGRSTVKLEWRAVRPSGELRRVFQTGLPSGLNNIVVAISQTIMNVLIARYRESAEEGDRLVAAVGACVKIVLVLVLPVFGLNAGLAPILGFCQGGGLPKRFRHACKVTLVIATGFSLVALLVIELASNQLPKIFDDDPEFVDVAARVLRVRNIGAWCLGVTVVAISVFQNLMLRGLALVASMARQLAFFAPFAFVFARIWGVWGVIYAQPAADVCSFLFCVACLYVKRHPAHFVKSEDAEFVQKTVASLIERGLPYDAAETGGPVEVSDLKK